MKIFPDRFFTSYKVLGFGILLALSIGSLRAQHYPYSKGNLSIDVFISNPCGGSTSNGFITFKVISSNNNATVLTTVLSPNGFLQNSVIIPDGTSFTYTDSGPDHAGSYYFLIHDNANVINTLVPAAPLSMVDLPAIVISQDPATTNNSNCTTPDGQVVATVSGGSKSPALTVPGSFTYTWTSNNGLTGLPTGTFDGAGSLNLAGLPGGTYTLLIKDNYSVCSQTKNFTITDPSPTKYATTTPTPSICLGSTGTVHLANSETAVTYEIYKGGVATGIKLPVTLPGTGGALDFTIPAANLTPAATYHFTIRAVNGSCTPVFMNGTATIVVNPTPTITGNLNVCGTGTTQLTGSGTAAAVTPWVSATPAVATVSATGLVTGVTVGTSVITYTDNKGCQKTATVSVNALPTITGNLNVCGTGTSQLTGSGTAAAVTPWVSATPAVATVSATGLVKGVSAGTSVITYTDNKGCQQTATVTVNFVTITGNLNVCGTGTTQLTGSGTAAAVTPWVSATPSVATVNATGLVTGVSAGTSVITYTDNKGCQQTATVTVDFVTITGNLNVCGTGTTQLTGSGTAAAVTPWVSATPSVATVNATGLVTGVTVGTSVITYTDNKGCQQTATVSVSALPTITGNLNVCGTGTTQLTGSGTAAAVTPWVSATPAVATVSATGLVTGVTVGTSVITYTDNKGCQKTATVTVKPTPTITGNLNVCGTGTTQLTGSGTAAAVTPWVSATPAVATVSATGLVTGVTVGTSVITYTDNTGCSQTATVTVDFVTITGNLNVCGTGTTQLTGSGTAAAVTPWVSATPAVATVSATGLVTGVTVGTSVITYTDNKGCQQTATVAVNAPPTITGNLNVCGTGTTQLTGSGTAAAVTPWVSATPSVATVNATGLVTGVTVGTSVITYTDNKGCTKTATVTVDFVTITGNLDVCGTGTTQLTGSGTAAAVTPWVSATPSVATVNATGLVTGVTAGTSVITYTDNKGCQQTATVTVNAPPTITGNLNVCGTGTTQLTGSGTAAAVTPWASATPAVATVSATGLVTGVTAGTSVITYTDNTGCQQTATVTVKPTPTITGNLNVCGTGTTQLTGSGTAAAVTPWVSATPAVATVSATGLVTGVTVGTSVITYTDNTGCSQTATVTVDFVTITGNLNVCGTGTTQLTGSGTAAAVTPWVSATPSVATVNATGLVTGVTVGTSVITYTDINGCSQTATVTVNLAPNATINPAGPFCFNDAPTNLTAVTPGGTWSGTGITDTSLGTFDPATAGVGVHSITYSVTVGSCTSVKSRNIGVKASPNATITPAGPFCLSDPTTDLTAATAGGTWSGTGIVNAATGAFDPATAGVGTFTITYSVTVGGCSDTKTTSITVTNAPDATITPAGPFCSNVAPVTLTAATAGGTWSGTGITNASTGTFDPATAGAGTFTITYSIAIGGCSDTKTTSIIVNAAPDATITPAGPFCITDSPVTLAAATGGGTWSGTGITNTATGAFDPATAGVGTFTITYSVTVGGCSDTKTTSITVTNAPDATITPAGPFCSNVAPVTLTAATAGGTWSGTGITNASTGTFDPATAGAGTFTITYSITIGGCSDTKTTSIIVNAAPDATITPAGPFCITDAPVTLAAATGGGIWSGTGITNTATGAFDPATAGVGTFAISYSVTTGSCTDNKSINITVANPPDATITPAGPFCSNVAPVTLTAATAGGTWSGTGITNTSTGTFDPAIAGAGTFTITYSITIGGCSDTKTTSIIVNAAPDATITPAGPFCITDAPVTLTAATGGGIWSGTGITNTATGAFDPATAGVGTFAISYSVTTGSCTDNKSINITVANPPDATITPAGPFCSNVAPVTLTAATAGGTWSGTGITNASTGTFDPATAGAGTFTITYSIAIGGCSDTKTTSIIVNAAPDATITPAGPFCITDAPVTLTAATGGGTWSGTGITNTATGAFDPATAGVGTFAISYSVTTGSCTDNKSINITVANPPDATITPAGPFCSNVAPVTLTAATAGGTWSGTGITNTSTGTFDPAIAGAGTFTITYSITIGGCSDTKTTSITVNAAPDATITPAGPFCITDAPVTLTAATGGGIWSGTGITNTATGAFDPATAGVGTFAISYSVTTGSCTDNKSINITVANPPDATITPAGPFCSNVAPVTLTAATAGGTWSGTGITNASTGTFDPATAGAGTFTITYSIAIGGCSDTKTTSIIVNAAPDATITPAGPFCITDAPVTLTAATGGGTWSGTGITNTATGAFDPATAGVGTFAISYSVTTGSCTDNKSINITVANPPDATITPAGPFCSNVAPVTLTAATAGGTWSGTGITNASTGTFDPATAGAGTFTITYSITIGGCSDTKTTSITVNTAPIVTITPAGPFCLTSPASNLSASVPGGTWSGTGITNAANGTFDPSVSGVGSFIITYSVTSGSCTSTATTTIQVNASCGGVNCGAFTILATDTRPTCSGQDDGTITINVTGGTPNYVATLSDPAQSFSQALAGPGPFTFINLSSSLTYTYTIQDGSGNSCTLPYSLPIQTNVQATASGFVDAQCFNQPVGQATVTVSSGGTSPYEYSLDAGTTWASFTSPVTITSLMPAATPYSILVRDDASDLCPAQVSVTIKNAVTDITTSFTSTDASCSNNDGTIQVGAVSGGTGPYKYRFDSVDYAALPANNTFTGLAGGTHKFTVIDAIGCSKYFNTTINFPGLVNFTTIFNNPDCSGSGNNGNIIVTITSSGTFDVGVTTDPVNDPTVFQTVVSAGGAQVTFNGLSQGAYYVVAKPAGALCPSRSLPIGIGGGPVAVDFTIVPEDFICFETKGMARITAIKGSSLVDYNYQIILAGSIIQSGTITQLQALPPDTINYTGLDKGNYQMILFQDQSAASGCASPISSSYKSFSINGPTASLDTLYVNRKFSLPNIPTGSMLIGIQESQEEPYQLMLHLVTPHLPGQVNNYAFDSTWVSVSRNDQNLIMEFNAVNLYGGDYRLSIRDTLGCTRTYDLSLDFDKDIFVPNVFTPNNDGKNDTFEILNLPDDSKLVITNRWGKEVYHSNNYENNWNGGSEVDGVYYYNLTAGGKTYTGWVEILHPSY